MSSGGQGMGYGSQGGYGGQSGGYGGQQYGGYGGGQSYGGYGGQSYGSQYGQSQYNPQRSYQPQSYGPPPMASGETQYTLGSQQYANGVRAGGGAGGGAGGVSGLPYQPAGGMMQQRQVTQTQDPGMNTGGNMMPQAPADSRGIAPPPPPEWRNNALQAPPMQNVQQAGPAPYTPGWINPALGQAQKALTEQRFAQQDTSGQGMGGQPFTGQKAYPAGYEFESTPSTLDPGSMNGLQAWMGGSNSPFGPNLGQQQQGYTNWYNQTYGQQAPGGPRRY